VTLCAGRRVKYAGSVRAGVSHNVSRDRQIRKQFFEGGSC
jgi:hypothetical protein